MSALPTAVDELERYTTAELFEVAQRLGFRPNQSASRENIVAILATRLPEHNPELPGTASASWGSWAFERVRSWKPRMERAATMQTLAHVGRNTLAAMRLSELYDLALSHGMLFDDDMSHDEAVNILMEHFVVHHRDVVEGAGGLARQTDLYSLGSLCRQRKHEYNYILDDRYEYADEEFDPYDPEYFETPVTYQENPVIRADLRTRQVATTPTPIPGAVSVIPPGSQRFQRLPVSRTSRAYEMSPTAASTPPPASQLSPQPSQSQPSVSTPPASSTATSQTRKQTGIGKRWAPPDRRKAKEHVNAVHPRVIDPKTGRYRPYPIAKTRTGRHCFDCCDIFREGSKSAFSDLGAGITLYFKFLKWGIGTFTVLSLVYLPLIVINTFGNVPVGSVAKFSLADTTLGNLGDVVNHTRVFIPSTTCGDERCSISKADAALVYGYIDLIAAIVFIVSYMWLRMFERTEASAVDRLSITISDYTVQVSRIPEDVTSDELKSHFETLTGCQVAEVSIARDNAELVSLSIKRGQIVRKLEVLEEEILIAQSKGKNVKSKLTRKVELKAKVKEIAARQTKVRVGVRALTAFVTFEDSTGLVLALDNYPGNFMQYFLQPRNLRLRGSHRLKVVRAPEPSTILWENLGSSLANRFARRAFTTALSAALLFASFALLWWASYQQKAASKTGGDNLCPATPVTVANVTLNPGLLHCYCKELSATDVLADSRCKKWVEQKTTALVISILASASVVVINALLQFSMRMLTKFELHHSLDTEALSMSRRLFISQFTNTAVVVLLANADVNIISSSGTRYSDFTTKWYSTVGGAIIVTMLLNIGSPQVMVFARVFYACCRRKFTKPLSQRQLNMLFTGPDFLLTARYSQVLNTMFVTLLYASGIPILVPICVAMLTVAYWIDKTLLCRFYRTPPLYNENLGMNMSGWLPYAIMLHLAFAVWMLSNPSIFQTSALTLSEVDQATSVTGVIDSNDKTGQRIRQKHTFPLFLVLLIVTGTIVLNHVGKRVKAAMGKALMCLVCGAFQFGDDLDRQFRLENPLPTLSTAISEKELRGLPSYNILKNPRFAHAFAISASFAEKHTELKDVLTASIAATSGEQHT